MRGLYRAFTDSLFDMEASTQEKIKNIWRSVQNFMMRLLQKRLEKALEAAMAGGGKEGAGGTGGGFGIGDLAMLALSLFQHGGWTGEGAANEPAGVVHRGEMIFEKAITEKNLPELLGLRKVLQSGIPLRQIMGYQGGGYTGGAAATTVSVNTSQQVRLLHEMTMQNRALLLKMEGLLQKDSNIVLQGTLSGQEFYRKEILPATKLWDDRKYE